MFLENLRLKRFYENLKLCQTLEVKNYLLFLSRKKIQKSLDKLNATKDWTSNPTVTASSPTKGNVVTTVLKILVIVSDRLPIMDHVMWLIHPVRSIGNISHAK